VSSHRERATFGATGLLVLVFVSVFAFAADARADQLSVDFESGPPLRTPVQDEYLSSAFVRFPKDPGFRPYRTDAGATKAHSGTIVADVGGGLCQLEGGDPVDCEFATGATTGQLTRTATAVTLFAGELQDTSAPATAKLIAHRTDGSTVESDPVMIDGSGVNKRLSVSTPAGDIDSFTLRADGGDLAFDDLAIDFAANSLPDMRPTATGQVVPVLAGEQTMVTVALNRLNNSRGPIRVSISGLPSGVTADPVTSGADADAVTLMLKGAPDAASTDFVPTEATITADPLGSADVAPGSRTTRLLVRVASPFDLRLAAGTSSQVQVGACAAADVALEVPRDIAEGDHVALSVQGVPAGVSAQVLPASDVAPGGNLIAERTLRFTRTNAAALPATVTVIARNSTVERRLTLQLARATPSATASPGLGLTPRGGPGTKITITGNGFCPGTRAQVGNSHAIVDTERIDEHTLTFTVPRLATSGPVKVLPPTGDGPFPTSNSLQVDSFRNRDAFQFANFPYGALSIDELTDAFGADDLFISVNPCGLWGGNCRVQTGILDPIAAIDWGVLNIALHSSGGHCFGISRAVEQLVSGHKSLRSFTTGGSVFSIPSATGPSDFLTSYLDGQHALQGSKEFLREWFNRDKSVAGQSDRLKFAIGHGFPIITMQHGGGGHAVIAYNARFLLDGTVEVDTYDNNRPFRPAEDTNGDLHAAVVDQNVLHLDTVNGAWSYQMADGEVWSGSGNDGSLFVAPEFTIPQDPSLPGLGTLSDALAYLVFGSTNDAVRKTGTPPGASYLPALDSHASPNSAGTLVTNEPGRALDATFEGVRNGHYSSAFIGNGFAASVSDVVTAPGVRDTVRGGADTLTFRGGKSRPLTLDLAQRARGGDATSWSASLHTGATANAADSAALTPRGTLTYRHDGAPATLTFTISNVKRGGAAARFDSGPMRIGRGEQLRLAPQTGLTAVAVAIRDNRGHVRHAVLRNHAKPPARLTVGRPKAAGRHISVRVRVARLKSPAVMGVVVRSLRGHRSVATRVRSVATVRNGSRTFTFTLPRGVRGRYLIRADVQLVATATRRVPAASAMSAGTQARLTIR
jgi:hypothetical protein